MWCEKRDMEIFQRKWAESTFHIRYPPSDSKESATYCVQLIKKWVLLCKLINNEEFLGKRPQYTRNTKCTRIQAWWHAMDNKNANKLRLEQKDWLFVRSKCKCTWLTIFHQKIRVRFECIAINIYNKGRSVRRIPIIWRSLLSALILIALLLAEKLLSCHSHYLYYVQLHPARFFFHDSCADDSIKGKMSKLLFN